MFLEKGRISNIQLMALMMGFTLGSSLVLTPGSAAGHDAWIAIILGFAESAVFATVYLSLANRFQNKNLFEINDLVFGRIVGGLISVFYLWYFYHVGSLVVRNFVDFLSIVTIPRTPPLLFGIVIVLVSGMSIKKGIEPLARTAPVLVTTIILIFATLFSLLLNQMHFENFFPILDIPLAKMIGAAHSTATFPFAETVVFMMLFPFTVRKQGLFRPVFGATFLACVYLTLLSIRTISVLGPTIPLFDYPGFQAVRMLNVAQVISRLELLIALTFLLMGFLKISVLFYATALGGAQLLRLRSYQVLVLPIGVLLVITAVTTVRNLPENIYFAQQIYPIYALPFQLGLPFLTLMTAVIRRLPRRDAR